MVSTKKGKRAENSLVNGINENTPHYVLAIPCGFSGNHVGASPDILVLDTTAGRAMGIELKTHGSDKTAVFEWSDDLDSPEDLNQMQILEKSGIKMYAAVNWSRAELAMWRAGPANAARTLVDNTPDKFNPRVAEKSGHFRVDNPRDYERRGSHPSARSGRPNWKVVVDTLGLPECVETSADSSERAVA